MTDDNSRASRRKRPLRGVLVTPGLLLGGAERWLVSLVKHTDCSRVRWIGTAISSAGGADAALCRELSRYTELHCQIPPQSAERSAVPFDPRRFDRIHGDWPRALRHLARRADVVLAWGAADVVAPLADARVPVVLVSHTTEPAPDSSAAGPTHLAAVSGAAAEYFPAALRAERPVTVIYNGAERARCRVRHGRPGQRQRWGLGPHDVAIGYVGRHAPEKNYLAAARAALALPERYRAIYYGSVVGRSSEAAPDLKRLAAEHPGRIRIHRPRSHLGDILAGLDVLMLASHREAFSLVLIEAWLAGVPVVATPVGSLPELQEMYGPLAMDVSGDPSPEELAAAVRRALGREGQAAAARARRIAHRTFTCEAMARRWMNYLEQVAAGVKIPQPGVLPSGAVAAATAPSSGPVTERRS